MKFDILISPRADHQAAAGAALKQGLEMHGHSARLKPSLGEHPVEADVTVCWSWRKGRPLAAAGHRVLVMERAYVGDRFTWTSFGWDGLNGNARFHVEDDGGDRWRKHFSDELHNYRPGGSYAVIMGQVPGDASLYGKQDLNEWYELVADRITAYGKMPCYFRDHPLHRGAKWAPKVPRIAGEFGEVVAGADLVIAWNSNALVNAALLGKDIAAGNTGTMAWPVASRFGDAESHCLRDRQTWADALAWTQWLLPEIASGDAIPHILAGADAPFFHERAFPLV